MLGLVGRDQGVGRVLKKAAQEIAQGEALTMPATAAPSGTNDRPPIPDANSFMRGSLQLSHCAPREDGGAWGLALYA